MTERVAGSTTAVDSREPSEAGSDLVDQAIRRFQGGSDRPGSFRFLYETYFRAIERFFARKGLPPEDCLDLTQETFLGIYKGLDGYEHRQQFAAWLYRVATTVYLKRLRTAATAKRAAVEVSRDGKTVSSVSPGRRIFSATKLRNGHVICAHGNNAVTELDASGREDFDRDGEGPPLPCAQEAAGEAGRLRAGRPGGVRTP